MTSKLKPCPSCEKEVAKSAKVCPNCGKKLSMGCLLKTILLLIAIIIGGFIIIITVVPSKEDQENKHAQKLAAIASAPTANILPTGEIAEMLALGSEHTAVQIDAKADQLRGTIVQWSLPVFAVTRNKNSYLIQTEGSEGIFGDTPKVAAFVTLYARNDEEVSYIESLKKGSLLTFKGSIKGIKFLHIEIDPAILVTASEMRSQPSAVIGNNSDVTEPGESNGAWEADEPTKEEVCTSMYRNLTPSDMTAGSIAEFKQDCPGFDLPFQWQEAASAATAVQSDLLPASFDCRKAGTSVEQIICGDPQISHLDGQLAKLYSAALRTDASQDAERTAQRAWIKLRNGCADASCVKAAYQERIAELR